MKMRELLEKVGQELADELRARRTQLLKERRCEIIAAERALARMKAQFEKLLDEDVDEGVFAV